MDSYADGSWQLAGLAAGAGVTRGKGTQPYVTLVFVEHQCVSMDLYGMMRKYCAMRVDRLHNLTRLIAVWRPTAPQVPVDSGIAPPTLWAHEALPRGAPLREGYLSADLLP